MSDQGDEAASVPLDQQAFSQLDALQSSLLDAIDSLRMLETPKEIPLPQLIVVGNQNCGKSSVLESISRVSFGVNHFVCTRFPTELILRRASTSLAKVTIKPGRSHGPSFGLEPTFLRTSFDPERLPELTREAEMAMGIRDENGLVSGFSDDTLRIEISGPGLPNLTLVDLPGLFESANKDQSLAEKTKVEKIVKRYMKDKRSIILVVVSGGHDPSCQSGPNLAEHYDKGGERTLGILTRIDSLEPGPGQELFLRCAKNDYINFSLGWHALRNRTPKERANQIPNAARDSLEEDFFSQPPWDEIPNADKGIKSLRNRLSKLLLDHVRGHLPNLIAEARMARTRRIREKTALGVPLLTYREQRNYLSTSAKGFQDVTERALDGKYDHAVFGYLGDDSRDSQDARLRAKIREMNRLFGQLLLNAGRKFQVDERADEDEEGDQGTNRSGQSNEENSDTSSDIHSLSSHGESSNVFADEDDEFHHGAVGQDSGISATFLQVSTVSKFYTHPRPTPVTRKQMESSVLKYVATWRGSEGHGDTNTALTKEVFKVQTSPWESIVENHSKALWEACERFVDLALDQTVHAPVRQKVKGKIIKPAMQQLRKLFFEKREEILTSHRNIDPSCYDGFINHHALAIQSNKLAERLGHWAMDNSARNDEKNGVTERHKGTENVSEGIYANFPLEMEQFSAARTVDLATLCLEMTTINLANTFTIMAVENCLIPGLRNLFSDTTIGEMAESIIAEITSDTPIVANRRKQLSEEIKILTGALKVFYRHERSAAGTLDVADVLDENIESDDNNLGNEHHDD
ncbi:hypothetical protein FNYG_07851 [Fusarium nygamai]|uniref:GED domain-containing protein n=1 Tax=Gibberella nygamai TaxID=42673 RepID=A0A2K0W935_GIBNY|nr:hypothetical protein FNYG_07851 [Fusarium nygamai]